MTDESQSKLDAAVLEFIADSEWNRTVVDGEEYPMVTTSWVLVAHQSGFDSKGDEISGYPIIYSGGSLPDHAAIGLLDVAQKCIHGMGRWGKEDDE